MKHLTAITCFSLLMGTQTSVLADNDFISDQRAEYDTIPAENIDQKRQEIQAMEKETLQRLYKENPAIEEEIKNAYGYGVFEGHVANLILYVAGKGFGVTYDNKTKTPVFMNAIRAGAGPGVGYKSLHGIFIFGNENVYKQFTTIGLHVSASGDAVIKVADVGVNGSKAVSLVPGIKYYQLVDTGLVLQANWGATEFLVDPNLNKK